MRIVDVPERRAKRKRRGRQDAVRMADYPFSFIGRWLSDEQVARTAARSRDRRVCGLRLFANHSIACDDPCHGKDADRKIGGPRYQLFTPLEELLGLELESIPTPVEVLVIDRVERPTPDE